jgi:hypothetical protein
MRIRWLRTALAQLEQPPNWIEEDFRAAGNDTVMLKVRGVIAAIKQLAEDPAPETSSAGRIAGTREQPLLFGYYTLIYRVRGSVFEVLGVLPATCRPD